MSDEDEPTFGDANLPVSTGVYKLLDLEHFAKPGRPPKFESPMQLLSLGLGYFEWCERNPFFEDKVTSSKDGPEHTAIAHMRAPTKQGMAIYCGCTTSTIDEYKKQPEYSGIIELLHEAMYDQKLAGAAAGLLNANIVARDLSLVDKREDTGSGNKAIDDLITEERRAELSKLLETARTREADTVDGQFEVVTTTRPTE